MYRLTVLKKEYYLPVLKTFASEIKKTFKLSLPLIIGQLGYMMMGVTDSMMVGHVGAKELAAAAISNGLFHLIALFGVGFTFGMTPLVAQMAGAGKKDECGIILRQGVLLNSWVSIVLTVLSLGAAEIIPYLNQPEEIVLPAQVYLRVLSASILPIMIFQSFKQFSEGLSLMKPAMMVTVLANGVNILANWLFIFGNLGMPEMGLTGAGIATIFSRLFMAACLIVFLLRKPKFTPFVSARSFFKRDKRITGKLIRIGLPCGTQYLFEVSAFVASAIIVGWVGTTALAAHQIVLNLASITYMVSLGISGAATVRVGNALGSKNVDKTFQAGWAAVALVVCIMGSFAILFMCFKSFLPRLYVSESKVIHLASSLLIIAALFQISDGIQTVGNGMLRGMTDMKIPTLITFGAYWGVGIPGAYILGIPAGFGARGVWMAILLSLSCSAVLMLIRFQIQINKAKHV